MKSIFCPMMMISFVLLFFFFLYAFTSKWTSLAKPIPHRNLWIRGLFSVQLLMLNAFEWSRTKYRSCLFVFPASQSSYYINVLFFPFFFLWSFHLFFWVHRKMMGKQINKHKQSPYRPHNDQKKKIIREVRNKRKKGN